MDIYKNLPIQINYGVILYDANDLDDDGDSKVLHFVGLADEPEDSVMDRIRDEFIEENPEYSDDAFNIKSQLADDDILEIYRDEYVNWVAKQN